MNTTTRLILTSEEREQFVILPQSYKPFNKYHLRELLSGKTIFLTSKRVFDILLSVFVIVFALSWITPLLALLIKLDSRGPVFFRQRRVGAFGKTFTCLKFRTMRVNKQADSMQATDNDPRITRVGRLLRQPGLDELPQFINVLLGQMSIIGPRPHMLKDHYQFLKVLPDYRVRGLVKPGITGISQVKGCRGLTDTFDAIYRRYQWDVYYVRNMGPGLDIKIVFMTFILMLQTTIGKKA